MTTQCVPAYGVDLFADAVIADSYPHYKALRDLGPAVWLPQHDCWAIARFADVRDTLKNDAVFISGEGVMLNDPTNEMTRDSLICLDGLAHRRQRMIVATPVLPGGLEPLRAKIEALAASRADELVARGRFDGVTDFAHYLPLSVVSHIVGLPEAGREKLLEWAFHIFNTFGPLNERCAAGLEQAGLAMAFVGQIDPKSMLPGSWGAHLFAMAERGEITDHQARSLMMSYVAPALDTTINATSSALWLLGQNQDQWEEARQDPALMTAAIEEAMRVESPVRGFARVTAEDADVDGTVIPKGDRVLVLYASANRDERHWPNPETFDIHREGLRDQLAFGAGAHTCVGMHLARLEMRCLFGALAKKVKRFEVANPLRATHNVLRGLKSLDVTIVEQA